MADTKKKAQQAIAKQNVLETLKGLGGGASDQMSDLLKGTSEDFIKELFGVPRAQPKRSGELSAGESLQMSEVLSGKEEENKKLKAQINLERQMSAEEKRLNQEKTNQLKVQLQALTSEISKVAVSTENLAEAAQVAIVEAPTDPGVYHIFFFENVLSFLHSFRKKIDQAAIWLNASNKRAEKKNYWARYKKGRGSFLLAPDHYLQRSAG